MDLVHVQEDGSDVGAAAVTRQGGFPVAVHKDGPEFRGLGRGVRNNRIKVRTNKAGGRLARKEGRDVRRPETGFRNDGIDVWTGADIGLLGGGIREDGPGVGPDDVGPVVVGPDDVGPGDIGPDNVGSDDVGPDDVGCLRGGEEVVLAAAGAAQSAKPYRKIWFSIKKKEEKNFVIKDKREVSQKEKLIELRKTSVKTKKTCCQRAFHKDWWQKQIKFNWTR